MMLPAITLRCLSHVIAISPFSHYAITSRLIAFIIIDFAHYIAAVIISVLPLLHYAIRYAFRRCFIFIFFHYWLLILTLLIPLLLPLRQLMAGHCCITLEIHSELMDADIFAAAASCRDTIPAADAATQPSWWPHFRHNRLIRHRYTFLLYYWPLICCMLLTIFRLYDITHYQYWCHFFTDYYTLLILPLLSPPLLPSFRHYNIDAIYFAITRHCHWLRWLRHWWPVIFTLATLLTIATLPLDTLATYWAIDIDTCCHIRHCHHYYTCHSFAFAIIDIATYTTSWYWLYAS